MRLPMHLYVRTHLPVYIHDISMYRCPQPNRHTRARVYTRALVRKYTLDIVHVTEQNFTMVTARNSAELCKRDAGGEILDKLYTLLSVR